jgi:hypothetical protein
VFPVRYELNIYISFRRNSVLKGLIKNIKSRLSDIRSSRIGDYGDMTPCSLVQVYR